jgi:ABC-2 type transport system permease protein
VTWRVELIKLQATLRVQVIAAGCVIGPILLVLAIRLSNTTPGDTLFGVWIRASGFAFSLFILNWAGLWLLPMSISVVAGDICSAEHRLGTWATILTRRCSRGEVLVGKVLAAATYTVVITLLIAVSTTAVGLIVIGRQPLVGLSGSLLSPHAALLATIASWASELAPMLALTGIAILSSVLSRNSFVGVLVPVVVFAILNLGSLLSAVDPIRPFLPTTGIESWHGLVREGPYADQILISVLVSLAWILLSFGLAAIIFLRRDVVDS